jgi:ADP-ribose pyrophosphatase YjhB (NUDIX family)
VTNKEALESIKTSLEGTFGVDEITPEKEDVVKIAVETAISLAVGAITAADLSAAQKIKAVEENAARQIKAAKETPIVTGEVVDENETPASAAERKAAELRAQESEALNAEDVAAIDEVLNSKRKTCLQVLGLDLSEAVETSHEVLDAVRAMRPTFKETMHKVNPVAKFKASRARKKKAKAEKAA